MTGVGEPEARVGGFWQFAAENPDVAATVDVDGSRLTFGEIAGRVNQLSHALRDLGVQPGQTVAVVGRNSVDFLVVALATSQVDLCFTPVSSHLTAPEIGYILRDSDADVVFVDRYTASLVFAGPWPSGCRQFRVFCLDECSGLRTLDELLAGYSIDPPGERSAGIAMLYTSGTSGHPKGVRPPARKGPPELIVPHLGNILRRFGIDPADHIGSGVHLVTSPLYHAAPMWSSLLALHMGHQLVVMPNFDAEGSLRLIESHRVTWTAVVPTMMKRWLDLDPEVSRSIDLSSLQWLIHGAAPCPIDVKRRILDWMGSIVYEHYASTEASGTAIGPQEWLEHPGSVGHVQSGAHVRILDEQGVDVPPGEVGQIYLRNLRPFCYHNDPKKTAAALQDDYVTVGDFGSLDSGGYLYIADRRTDLIISGGVNIYPAEIEATLLAHPSVADAAVIGVPDPDLNQVVHAVVEPKLEIDQTDLIASLQHYCHERLGSQKRPRTIELRSALPRTATGKLLRRVLRDEYAVSPAESEPVSDVAVDPAP
jgi:long-chain acyl-CoA synthetase